MSSKLPPYLPFEWIVALRFLREGRLQTLFIIVGVAIGVGVIVFMSALLSGLQGNFIRRVLSAQAHIQLLPPQQVTRALRAATALEQPGAIVQPPLQKLKSIDQWQAVAAQARSTPGVVVVSPLASGSALLLRGNASRAISVNGIEPELYYRIVDLQDKLVRGQGQINATDILIGLDLAHDLGVAVGDKLRLTTASGGGSNGNSNGNSAATPASVSTLSIAGIFDLGNKGANLRSTFVTLHTAQSLLGLPGGVTSLDVTVADVYAAERIAQLIAASTGVEADSWIKSSAQFFSAVSAQTTANTAIRFFVGLSVAFGIASVLVVVVVQKSREIGILRAMGISQAQILRVFLLQGGLLGLGGSLAGSAIGALALGLWQRYARNADGTPLFPLVFDPRLFAAALLLATLTGLIAAFAPALRAARLDPVVAIRA
ncbi:FtsX-like permease family protein [Paucibacter sp. Y2R2-4]|uniref:FtsX-like permease family protein n=1 Tax=Paucibacter sp. Y2R2-4 TaxID=2893553 RepID=UPI0021E3A368|nr:FtsX-like permease family protein [Paucibacter sp. Y2R2-4]MCV2350434.1 FtsX-like permease family protein [Paucibacter sp. Y2R2-4]